MRSKISYFRAWNVKDSRVLVRRNFYLVDWIGSFLFVDQRVHLHPPSLLLPFSPSFSSFSLLFLFFFLIIYLFLAVLGLRFCARAFSSCSKRGPLFIAVRRPLTVAAFLVAEHRLQTHRLSSCGSRAQLLRGMWDLPRSGLEPVSPAFAGRFSTTAPRGKPHLSSLSLLFLPEKYGSYICEGVQWLPINELVVWSVYVCVHL